jgi:hypothetical protein
MPFLLFPEVLYSGTRVVYSGSIVYCAGMSREQVLSVNHPINLALLRIQK